MAGVVLAAGPKSRFRRGQRVFGVAPGCLKSTVVTHDALLAEIPSSLTFQEAASLPVAATTVEYCFRTDASIHNTSRIKRDSRVLIHAATGGVGLFAVQLCLQRYELDPANVFVTAGNVKKRQYLKDTYSLTNVMSSRDPTMFRAALDDALGNRRLNIVLNSLSGDYIRHSVDMLASNGLFIEIGKRDIWSKEQMEQYRPDIQYEIVAVDTRIQEDPQWFTHQLSYLTRLVETQKLHPIPISVFRFTGPQTTNERTADNVASSVRGVDEFQTPNDIDAQNTDDPTAAFRYLQRAHHIGKVIVQIAHPLDPPPLPLLDVGRLRNSVVPNALREHELAKRTILITGGLGALGRATARWLLHAEGVLYLVLCSRRPLKDTVPVVASLISANDESTHQNDGTTVGFESHVNQLCSVKVLNCGVGRIAVAQLDVTKEEALEILLHVALPQLQFPNVSGIFHLSGLLNDKPFARETRDSLRQPLEPKLGAALTIRRVLAKTQNSLDFFVAFSSIAARWGNFGQAAYAGANATLDFMCQFLSSKENMQPNVLGIAAYREYSLQFGPWAGEGMAAATMDAIRASGVTPLSLDVGFRCLHDVMTKEFSTPVMGCAVVDDWGALLNRHGLTGIPASFKPLVNIAKTENENNQTARGAVRADVLEQLRDASEEEIKTFIFTVLEATAQKVVTDQTLSAVLGSDTKTTSEPLKPLSKSDRVEKTIPLDMPLMEMGMDSLAAVEFCNELGLRLGIELPPTALFNYPTFRLLRDYLAEQITKLVRDSKLKVTTDPDGKRKNPIPSLKREGFFDHKNSAYPVNWNSFLLGVDAPIFDLANRLVLDTTPVASQTPGAYAIVGMACAFPGQGRGISEFWNTLLTGTDCVKTVPPARFCHVSSLDSLPCYAGLLDQSPEMFDCDAFNLCRKEARWMDPHLRRMLELSYEAFCDAELSVDRLAARPIGVYIGCSNSDWVSYVASETKNTAKLSGAGAAMLANRVSHTFQLRGPSLTIDTACSSALTALDAAIAKLETDFTVEGCLVGAVNLLLLPQPFIALAKAGLLARDGRCKVFDERADGYGRGEGGACVLLYRLADAERSKHIRRIVAVIRGSYCNHDGMVGRLAAPNPDSQGLVLRKALQTAGMPADRVSVVECHGAGTILGDAIEAAAVKSVHGTEARKRNGTTPADNAPHRLFLGSVKTNIGHLEGAAGIAGLIKVCLSLRHEFLPPSLHFQVVNPKIDFDAYNVCFPVHNFPSTGTKSFGCNGGQSLNIIRQKHPELPLCAGVSAFGFGGSNVHVIVEQYKGSRRFASGEPGNLADKNGEKPHSSAELDPLLRDESFDPQRLAQLVFLFTGQGSYDFELTKRLIATELVFRDALLECDNLLRPRLQEDFVEIITQDITAIEARKAIVPLAVLAVQYGLFQVLIHEGFIPSFVLGHSLGEYMAAVAAGVMSLKTVLLLLDTRTRLIDKLPSRGVMVACRVDPSSIRNVLDSHLELKSVVAIAAVNGPRSTVVSGDAEAVESLFSKLNVVPEAQKKLLVSHAYHSPLIQNIVPEFYAYLSSLTLQPPKPNIKFISTVSGHLESGDTLCAPEYWVRHTTDTVRFQDALIYTVAAQGRIMVEIGTKPTLVRMGPACVSSVSEPGIHWIHVLENSESFAQRPIQACMDTLRAALQRTSTDCDLMAIPGFDYKKQLWSSEWIEIPDVALRHPATFSLNSENTVNRPAESSIVLQISNIWRSLCAAKEAASNCVGLQEFELRASVNGALGGAFHQALEQHFGVKIPLEQFLAFTTLEDVARCVENDLNKQNQQAAKLSLGGLSLAENPRNPVKVYVTGLACRLPGNASSPEAFWNVLTSGRDCFTEVPKSRFNVDLVYRPYSEFLKTSCVPNMATYCRVGAFLSDAHLFDNQRFQLPLKEIMMMDPHHRLMLEVSCDAALDASFPVQFPSDSCTLRNNNNDKRSVGVYIGFADLHEWLSTSPQKGTFCLQSGMLKQCGTLSQSVSRLLSTAPCLLANRISHLCDWTGPSMTLDTGCSAATAALSVALDNLTSGLCSMAIVGGVSLMLTPLSLIGFSSNRLLSPTDRVNSFGDLADGTLRGEGAVAIALTVSSKPIPNAYAIVRSCVSNASGKAHSMGIPHPEQHKHLLTSALAAAQCTPCDIGYIETHGVGIPFADISEMAGFTEVFQIGTKESPRTLSKNIPLVFGAVHATAGHSNGALGAAQLIKMILSLSEGIAPPICNFTTVHPQIKHNETLCIFPTKCTPIASLRSSRFGLLNTLGIGGVSAAAVLEVSNSQTRRAAYDEQLNLRLKRRQHYSWDPLPIEFYRQHLHASPNVEPSTLIDTIRVLLTDRIKQFRLNSTLEAPVRTVTIDHVNDHVLFFIAATPHLLSCNTAPFLELYLLRYILEHPNVTQCTVLFWLDSAVNRAELWEVGDGNLLHQNLSQQFKTVFAFKHKLAYYAVQPSMGAPFAMVPFAATPSELRQFEHRLQSVTRVVLCGFHRRSVHNNFAFDATTAVLSTFYTTLVNVILAAVSVVLQNWGSNGVAPVDVHVLTHVGAAPRLVQGFRNCCPEATTASNMATPLSLMSSVYPSQITAFEWSQWLLDTTFSVLLPELLDDQASNWRCFVHRLSPLRSNSVFESLQLFYLILATQTIPQGVVLDMIEDGDVGFRLVR